MKAFTPINLAALPDPQVVEIVDYEQILAERKAYMIALWPADQQATIAATLELESEPLTKLLQENAYRETLWRQRVNEAALGTMLAKARGADLEQIAAGYDITRLTIVAANPSAVPPVAAVMEDDDALRERCQMAFEGLSTAGPRNSYIFHARSADGRVADATAESPSPCVVVLTVQSALGDGSADTELLDTVAAYCSDENRRPLGDRLIVQGAEVLHYSVNAVLHMSSTGPETDLILDAARRRLHAYVTQRHRLGVEVSESALHAALHVEGVRKVELVGWTDITPTSAQAAYCSGYTVSAAGAT